MRRFFKILLKYILPLAVILFVWSTIRTRIQRKMQPPAAAWIEQAKSVKIIRDEWGVPHIFGKTDADAAFGLAYAHCEDDFKFIQGGLVAARGDLSLLVLSKQAIINDYYVRLFKIRQIADSSYDTLKPETKRLLDAYANGVNYYAAKHPDEADGRFFPATGKDLAAAFVHKIPLFVGADQAMKKILGSSLKLGDPMDSPVTRNEENVNGALIGSNSHAVSSSRTTNGATFLNINSHQPWEGPVAWYEAHVHSDEGWNMTGGTFPGAPVILHGHNDFLGWAHTVNYPDLVDVYKLETEESNGAIRYKLDGEWKDLEIIDAKFPVDIGILNFPFSKKAYASVHGPVLKSDDGYFAVRVAGIERMIGASEQWYMMNKARNLAEFKTAMKRAALPMFNTLYADATHTMYVYNGLLPVRKPGPNYRTVLPGNDSSLIWHDYLPFDKLPRVENPPSGYIENCNSTPFQTTTGPGNPDPKSFDASFGIENRMTNRAIRSHEMLSGNAKLSWDDFLRMKWDRSYSKNGPIYRYAINPLKEQFKPENDLEKEALNLVMSWNGRADDSPGAALSILLYRPMWKQTDMERNAMPDVSATFREAISFLKKNFGRVDVPLSEVQRMRHGKLDMPLMGGPDVMNAAHSEEKDGHIIGMAGDSYVLMVEFKPGQTRSWSVHQFGNSTHPESKHFSDQMPLFLSRLLKPTLRSEKELAERKESEYSP